MEFTGTVSVGAGNQLTKKHDEMKITIRSLTPALVLILSFVIPTPLLRCQTLPAAAASPRSGSGADSAATEHPVLSDDSPAASEVFEGTLSLGIFAIGGETTGVLLRTKTRGTWELDLTNDEALLKLARQLDGGRVVVVGTSRSFPGIEVERRQVIIVKSIKKQVAFTPEK